MLPPVNPLLVIEKSPIVPLVFAIKLVQVIVPPESNIVLPPDKEVLSIVHPPIVPDLLAVR
jgi:hypothetical protein